MNKKTNLSKLVRVALFAAIATVLMALKFPVAFIAPSFYKLDFSEVAVLAAGFSMGALPAVAVELLKVLLNFLIDGTVTAGIGELSNFMMGCMFVVPATLIYRSKKTFASAVVGLAAGTLTLVAGASAVNYLLLIPAYVKIAGFPLDAIIAMGAAVTGKVTDLKSLVLFTTAPFNILKGVASSALFLAAYRPLKRVMDAAENKNK